MGSMVLVLRRNVLGDASSSSATLNVTPSSSTLATLVSGAVN